MNAIADLLPELIAFSDLATALRSDDDAGMKILATRHTEP
jgi:hypothetical protein